MRSLFTLCLFAVLACKGDPVKCDQAVRNFHQLMFWEQANAEIDRAPPAQRDELRKQKAAELARNLDRWADLYTSKCTSANDERFTDCLIKAKTAGEARACVRK
jgi:hypothetical protein